MNLKNLILKSLQQGYYIVCQKILNNWTPELKWNQLKQKQPRMALAEIFIGLLES